jgi:hypothetical protein
VATPETRYARSGDVSIAYQVVGERPNDIVFIPGFVSNLELDVRSVLPAVRTPTLIIRRTGAALPIESARYVARRVPGARIAALAGPTKSSSQAPSGTVSRAPESVSSHEGSVSSRASASGRCLPSFSRTNLPSARERFRQACGQFGRLTA